MKYLNDRVLHFVLVDYVTRIGKKGIGEKILELEARIDELAQQLEKKRKPGRPKKSEEVRTSQFSQN
jgi:hypothetical protein